MSLQNRSLGFKIAVVALLVLVALGSLGAAAQPANAAYVAPSHSGSVQCQAFSNRVWVIGNITGHSSTRYEYGSWYPRFQIFNQGRWQNIYVPGYTEQWTTLTVSRLHPQTMTITVGPETGNGNLPSGYYYRVVSWFHWSSNNYMTPAEFSQPCLLQGL